MTTKPFEKLLAEIENHTSALKAELHTVDRDIQAAIEAREDIDAARLPLEDAVLNLAEAIDATLANTRRRIAADLATTAFFPNPPIKNPVVIDYSGGKGLNPDAILALAGEGLKQLAVDHLPAHEPPEPPGLPRAEREQAMAAIDAKIDALEERREQIEDELRALAAPARGTAA